MPFQTNRLTLFGSFTYFTILKTSVILKFKIMPFLSVTLRDSFSICMAQIYSHPGYFIKAWQLRCVYRK